jgi:hypothetical protein
VVFFVMAAFFKVNGRPFIHFVENSIKFVFSKKIYLWKKKPKKPEKGERAEARDPKMELPKLSQSKLKELTWGLDIHENLVEKSRKESKKVVFEDDKKGL